MILKADAPIAAEMPWETLRPQTSPAKATAFPYAAAAALAVLALAPAGLALAPGAPAERERRPVDAGIVAAPTTPLPPVRASSPAPLIGGSSGFQPKTWGTSGESRAFGPGLRASAND